MITTRLLSPRNLMLATALFLAACSGSESDADSEAAGEEAGSQASAGTSSGEGATLDTTPIPSRDIYDYRDGSEPVSRTEAVQLDDCPLLSLDTLHASTGTYAEPTVISEATAQRCTFSNTGAFTFSVFVEPAADVDVDNHSSRAYNLDVEPIVEPQSGPGEKAVILIDTAFADTLDNEGTRYLYFFVLGDQAVTLRSTAFKIQDDGWRALADEVAANLASGAAGGEIETTEVVDEVAPYAYEPCGWVTIEQIAALGEFDAADITFAFDPGRSQCKWTHPDAGSLNVNFGANQLLYAEAASGNPDGDRGDELGILAVGSPVFYDVWLGPDTLAGFTMNPDSEQWYRAADALAINLSGRIENPGF